MPAPSVEEAVEGFLRRDLAVRADDPAYSRQADLFEGGWVDSIGFAELLEFLRETYGVEVPEDDLLSDEFSTVEGIAGVVRRLAPEAGGVA